MQMPTTKQVCWSSWRFGRSTTTRFSSDKVTASDGGAQMFLVAIGSKIFLCEAFARSFFAFPSARLQSRADFIGHDNGCIFEFSFRAPDKFETVVLVGGGVSRHV